MHYKAMMGNSEAKSKASAWLEKACLEDPDNSLLAAYHADCMSMAGYASKDSAAMFSNAIKAMKLFDQAINMDPEVLEIRFLRAYHSYRLPQSFFQRTATAINDWEYLAKRYEEDSALFPENLYEDTLLLLGKAYLRMNMESEARGVWKKLGTITGNNGYKIFINKELRMNSADYPVGSSNPASPSLEDGIRLHDLAVAGCGKASQMAFEVMQKLFENNTEDPIVEGYYGSAMALAARDSGDTGRMFADSIKAMQHLKRAVAKRMYDPRLRLMRGYLLYNLPEVFFHLSAKAAKDFKFLKTAYENDNSIFSKEQYWQVMYDLGVCYKNNGDDGNAEKVWKKLLQECPGNRFKERIQGWRSENEDPGEAKAMMQEPCNAETNGTEITAETKTAVEAENPEPDMT